MNHILQIFSRQYPTEAPQPTSSAVIYLFLLCWQQIACPCSYSRSRFPSGNSQLGQYQQACSPNKEKPQSVRAAPHLSMPCKPEPIPPAHLCGASCGHLQEGRNRGTCLPFVGGHEGLVQRRPCLDAVDQLAAQSFQFCFQDDNMVKRHCCKTRGQEHCKPQECDRKKSRGA